MSAQAGVIEILKNEYGIESAAQLQQAIENLGFLDLAPFCAELPKKEVGHEKRKKKV